MTLHRKAPIRRHKRANLKPRKPLPKKNGKRREKAFRRAYGSKERVEWTRLHGCVVCARVPCDNAHVVGGGMGRKADADRIVPLCREHHDDLHRFGLATFQRVYLTDLPWAAELHAAAWREWQGQQGLEPIGSIVPRVLADLLDGEDA